MAVMEIYIKKIRFLGMSSVSWWKRKAWKRKLDCRPYSGSIPPKSTPISNSVKPQILHRLADNVHARPMVSFYHFWQLKCKLPTYDFRYLQERVLRTSYFSSEWLPLKVKIFSKEIVIQISFIKLFHGAKLMWINIWSRCLFFKLYIFFC